MNRNSVTMHIDPAVKRTIPVVFVIVVLVLGAACAMCFVPELSSHSCCHRPPGDYLLVEGTVSPGCGSLSASLVASFDRREDPAPRPQSVQVSYVIHAPSTIQDSPGWLRSLLSSEMVSPASLNNSALRI